MHGPHRGLGALVALGGSSLRFLSLAGTGASLHSVLKRDREAGGGFGLKEPPGRRGAVPGARRAGDVRGKGRCGAGVPVQPHSPARGSAGDGHS